MKKLLLLLLICLLIDSISGCKKIDGEEYQLNRTDVISCISGELEKLINYDDKNMYNISIDDLLDNKLNNISYYEGKYINEDNRYILISSDLEDNKVSSKIHNYFNEKYDEYYNAKLSSNIDLYLHTDNNLVDLDKIKNKCLKVEDNSEQIKIDDSMLNKYNKTNKIVIKNNGKNIGIISDKNSIQYILDAINNSSISKNTNNYLSDTYTFTFEMYNGKKKIDTIDVWYDGMRILPESSKDKVDYYYINDYGFNLMNIIQKETNYKFYSILSVEGDNNKKIVYKDNKYIYYYESKDDLYIRLLIDNRVMKIDYAIKNKYIDIDDLLNDKVLIKEAKN